MCVIDTERAVPAEYTTCFRRGMVFGPVQILQGEEEKGAAIEKLAVKYAPDDTAENRRKAIAREWTPLCMLEMTIDHMTGKEAIELARANRQADE